MIPINVIYEFSNIFFFFSIVKQLFDHLFFTRNIGIGISKITVGPFIHRDLGCKLRIGESHVYMSPIFILPNM